ncbi:MAG: glycosyltransferase family 4 protein [Bacteroidales bacterium]|nr:glycosyltransferase family 4 protein [Bacteroidales bacterium]
MNKLKVALVCSFSNAKVREHLPLSDRKLYRLVRRVFGLSTKNGGYGNVAGWDTYMIELLRKRDDIDLTVISAHTGLTKRHVAFDLEGVHYHFVRVEGATLLKHLISSPSLWHRLNPMRPVVRNIVKKTQPDVLALIGAENAHISGTVLGIEGIPLIVKCQTIYNNPDRGKSGPVDAKNAYVERLIFKDLKYVAVGTGMHCRLFRQFNRTAYNFKWALGNLLPEVKPLDKEYDFVNYAMGMSDKKGYPDAIKALAIVQEKYPNVKLNLVGGNSKEEKEALEKLVANLHLESNVMFTPFFEKQEDLFQHLQKSRFALLPCKIDSVASTIRQAMHYELPVVCYKTDGTPKLNEDQECVLIAENGNVEDLATKMLMLLDDDVKANQLRNNAKEFSRRWSDDQRNSQQMSDNFHAVVEHYHNGTPIPADLLCNENIVAK